MVFDICFVTYNSEKWLNNCIKSFANLNFDLKKITLCFTDNASVDGTVNRLYQLKEEYGTVFNDFIIIELKENLGFGKGSNTSAKACCGDIVFFCNIDTEIDKNALVELENAIVNNSDYDAFELRQFPYEHPKFYNPYTLEVDFASGACFVLKRDLFELTGGFDESIFMYAEDVDLSFRIRLLNKKIRYVPSAIINHYSYASAGEEKPMQAAGGILGNYILRAKYSSDEGLKIWNNMKNNAPNYFKDKPQVRRIFDRYYKTIHSNHITYRKFYRSKVKNSKIPFYINGFDYCFAKSGAFYENFKSDYSPYISVIVRTHNRPDMLRLCLTTLTYQTYKNFEVIVCEDGETPQTEKIAEEFINKLSIRYFAMGSSVGRCMTANKGVENAKGEYINFLDDDDCFYPEHLEVVAGNIVKHPTIKMFVTGSVAVESDSELKSSTCFNPGKIRNVLPQSVELRDMLSDNRMPIQAVTFHKSLANEYGVFDNTFIDGYEDWELWTRYISHTKCYVIEKATSLYRLPCDAVEKNKRALALQKNLPLIREAFKDYKVTVEGTEIFDVLYGENSTKERIDILTAFLESERVYNEIIKSRFWNLIDPVRRFFALGWKGVYHFYIVLQNTNDKIFGPMKYQDNKDLTPTQYNDFIVLTQKSFLWKIVMRLCKNWGK